MNCLDCPDLDYSSCPELKPDVMRAVCCMNRVKYGAIDLVAEERAAFRENPVDVPHQPTLNRQQRRAAARAEQKDSRRGR